MLRLGSDAPSDLSSLEYDSAGTEDKTTLQATLSSTSTSSAVSKDTTKAKKRKGKSKSRERRGSNSPAIPDPESPVDGPSQLSRIPTPVPTTITDVWKVYEDVCLLCAGAWMGSLSARAANGGAPPHGMPGHNPNSACENCLQPLPTSSIKSHVYPTSLGHREGASTSLRLEGDDDVLLQTLRSAGKMREVSGSSQITTASGVSGAETLVAGNTSSERAPDPVQSTGNPQVTVTLNLLSTLDQYAEWQIGVLRAYVRSLVGLPERRAQDKSGERDAGSSSQGSSNLRLTLTPRDMVLLDLNPLSSGDVRYLESLAKEYAGHVVVHLEVDDAEDPSKVSEDEEELEGGYVHQKKRVNDMNVDLVVKRGWKELVAVVFGFV